MSQQTLEEQLKQRLEELKAEGLKGQQMLMETESQAQNIKESLLRINGAIQVLEEELAKMKGD
jgi:uncharacterized protein (DUF3084 family)